MASTIVIKRNCGVWYDQGVKISRELSDYLIAKDMSPDPSIHSLITIFYFLGHFLSSSTDTMTHLVDNGYETVYRLPTDLQKILRSTSQLVTSKELRVLIGGQVIGERYLRVSSPTARVVGVATDRFGLRKPSRGAPGSFIELTEQVTIPAGQNYVYNTRLAFSVPVGTFGQIFGSDKLTVQRGLLLQPTFLGPDDLGTLKLCITNIGLCSQTLYLHEHIATLICSDFRPLLPMEIPDTQLHELQTARQRADDFRSKEMWVTEPKPDEHMIPMDLSLRPPREATPDDMPALEGDEASLVVDDGPTVPPPSTIDENNNDANRNNNNNTIG